MCWPELDMCLQYIDIPVKPRHNTTYVKSACVLKTAAGESGKVAYAYVSIQCIYVYVLKARRRKKEYDTQLKKSISEQR